MAIQIPPHAADGWTVLHQVFSVNWSAINALSEAEREHIAKPTESFLEEFANPSEEGQSACFHLLGHKGDLMFIHFRKDFALCTDTELALNTQPLAEYLDQSTSYLSVIELGLYHATIQIREELEELQLKPNSREWHEEFKKRMSVVEADMSERIYPTIPERRFVSFYPMSKRRGESKNWYALDLEERGMFMMEHGTIGRKYAGRVNQIITGSIGYDDWEWGVDLFVDDPLVCKELVYEMRFDEGSALYGEFGPFYFAQRIGATSIGDYLSGTAQKYSPTAS